MKKIKQPENFLGLLGPVESSKYW